MYKSLSQTALVLSLIVAAAGQAQAQVSACTSTSSNDAPYRDAVPADLAQAQLAGVTHGSLLRCFVLSPAWSSWYTGIDYLDRVYITRHVTSDGAGQRVLGSAAVFTSSEPAYSQASPRPTMVLNTATVGIPAKCGASTQLLHATSVTLRDDVQRYLKSGFTVVVPDYFGHGVEGQPARHSYLEGRSLGQSVLDAVLAARALPASPVGPTLAMEGFSQGGQATLWAQHLASSYAPTVQLSAIRAGGATVDMDDTVARVGESYYFGGSSTDTRALPAAFVGMSTATVPGSRITESQILAFTTSSAARGRVQTLMAEARSECRTSIGIQAVLFGGTRKGDFDLNAFRALNHAAYQAWANANSLVSKVPNQPGRWTTVMQKPGASTKVAYYGASEDEMVPPRALRDVSTRLWAPAPLSSHGFKASLLNANGNLSIDRSASSAWLDFDPETSHAFGDQPLYDDDDAENRYTPGEWLADAVYGLSRELPDPVVDSSN